MDIMNKFKRNHSESRQAILHTHIPKNMILMCDSASDLLTGKESVVMSRECPTLQNHAVTDYATLCARFKKIPILLCRFMGMLK